MTAGLDLVIDGCDVPDWIPFLTAAEAGLDRPKWTIDFKTGIEYISYPVGWPLATGAPVVAPFAPDPGFDPVQSRLCGA